MLTDLSPTKRAAVQQQFSSSSEAVGMRAPDYYYAFLVYNLNGRLHLLHLLLLISNI